MVCGRQRLALYCHDLEQACWDRRENGQPNDISNTIFWWQAGGFLFSPPTDPTDFSRARRWLARTRVGYYTFAAWLTTLRRRCCVRLLWTGRGSFRLLQGACW